MVRLVAVLAVVSALAGCERMSSPEAAPTRADSLRQALSDSLYEAEMARRQQATREVQSWTDRSRRHNLHGAALWEMVTADDWSAAHDTVILDGLYKLLYDDLDPAPWRATPLVDGVPERVWTGPPIPLARFRDGMPRSLDPFGRAVDAATARYGVADRVRVVSRTDTLRRERSFAGFTIYTVSTETRIESVAGATLRVSQYELEYPRQLHAVLAVRDGLARPLRVASGRGGIWTDVVPTPAGRVLAMRYNAHGSRFWDESYAEYRAGRWRHLGRDRDLDLDPVPPLASVYRDRTIDLARMEMRASVEATGNIGYDGCLVAPIRRRRGRLVTGPAVWHRRVASCEEYAFVPTVEVTRDTSQYEVSTGGLMVEVVVRAGRDTTSRFQWRLLDARGGHQWSGDIPAGFAADSTYRFERQDAMPGNWTLIQTRRRERPHFGVVRAPPHVGIRTQS